MQFGDRRDFAIELLIDWPLTQLPEPTPHVSGRIRAWVADEPIGDLDDWGCWLMTPMAQILERARFEGALWSPRLESRLGRLDPEGQYEELARIFFSGRHGELLGDGPEVARLDAQYEELRTELQRDQVDLSFLIHSSEAFDGWCAFTLRPPGAHGIRILWAERGGEVRSHEVANEVFRDVAARAHAWLVEQEEEWRR